MVIDTIGQRAKHLSTKGSLRIMEFVRKYMVGYKGCMYDVHVCQHVTAAQAGTCNQVLTVLNHLLVPVAKQWLQHYPHLLPTCSA
jgi:hypothetical protein